MEDRLAGRMLVISSAGKGGQVRSCCVRENEDRIGRVTGKELLAHVRKSRKLRNFQALSH